MKHSLLGTRRVILSISTRNFFVIRNKQPMTIGTNWMCISRDDNCINTMSFPRQLPTTARNLLSWLSSTGVIQVVPLVSYLLVSYFVVNFFGLIFSVCHSFRSMCQPGWPPATRIQITFMSAILSQFGERKIPPSIKWAPFGERKARYGKYSVPFGDNKARWRIK